MRVDAQVNPFFRVLDPDTGEEISAHLRIAWADDELGQIGVYVGKGTERRVEVFERRIRIEPMHPPMGRRKPGS